MIGRHHILCLLSGVPAFVFLLFMVATQVAIIHSLSVWAMPLLLLFCLAILLTRLVPSSLRWILLLLGCSLPLFGFQSYTLQSQVAQLLIAACACLVLLSPSEQGGRGVGTVSWALLLYLVLAILSLMVLPVPQMLEQLRLWGIFDFMHAVQTAHPHSPLYSLAAVGRLLLFGLFAVLIGRRPDSGMLCRFLGIGVGLAILWACVLGLAEEVNLVNLEWYRSTFKDASGIPRLHSVFGNPGWFAQFVVIGLPFLLLLVPRRLPLVLRVLLLLLGIGLASICLLLTASRTSWLILPFMVFACIWYFWLDREEDGYSWRYLLLSGFKVGGGLVTVIVLVAALAHAVLTYSKVEVLDSARGQYLVERSMFHRVGGQEERFKLWRESLAMVSERPWDGFGYESYKWNQQAQMAIPTSRFFRHRLTEGDWDTPHNFFLQLLVSNGLIGLCLWGGGIAFLASILIKGGRDGVIYAMALAGFHLYGLTQSVTYVPIVFFLFFIIMAYGLGQHGQVRAGTWTRLGLGMATVAVLTAGLGYYDNRGGRVLAAKFGVTTYGATQGLGLGFHDTEDWGITGNFRWTGRQARMPFTQAGVYQVEFVCGAPRLDSHPLTVDIRDHGVLIDRFTFWQPGSQHRLLSLAGGTRELVVAVSRTWTPSKEGAGKDSRILGVAVGEPTPVSGAEFGLSAWQANPLSIGGPTASPQAIRYASALARIDLTPYQNTGVTLFLGSAMPFLDQQPLVVQVGGVPEEGAAGHRLEFQSPAWQTLNFSPADIRRAPLLTVTSSRLWNPRKMGYGKEGRDLGVAVGVVANPGR